MEGKYFDLSQDATLGGDSPSTTKIPSEAALKAYIDAKAAGAGANYFYVEDASGAANTLTIKKSNNALADKVFEWSYDKATWTEITIENTTGVSIPISANGKVYLRGDNETLTANNGQYYTKIGCSANFNIGGDLTTLLHTVGSQFYATKYYLAYLFNQSKVVDASALILPAKSLMDYSYAYMFRNCTALTQAPALPATTLASNCYAGMFSGCTTLNHVEVYATAWNNPSNWLNGVAATGDFYNLGGATIPTGTNGIPSGWTEHTQLP